jgi:3-oxoacyl-[acyl-carrier protein] reductase
MLCARNQEGLDDVVASLRARNVEAAGVAADVSQISELERVFTAVDDTHGHLHVLVANAGGPPPGKFLRVTEEQWVTAFNLTLMSAVRAMQMAIPACKRRAMGGLS